ncbi:MAG: hypothetical protein K6F59_04900 [Gammaproteobacteria bacterium]|nr:hypothetical protein [Gammaproteobacteria bacterium]
MSYKLNNELLNKIKDDIKELLNDSPLSLYNVEFNEENGVDTLTVTVDKVSGYIDIDEIEDVTNKVNEYLDKTDPIDTEYSLVVTSRGIEKELTIDELPNYINEYLFIRTFEQELYGTLLSIEGAVATIKNPKNKKVKINLNDIEFVRIAIKF